MSSFAKFAVPWDGWEYTPTEHDRLVLATAIYGETRGSHTQDEWKRMAWTWFNRFALKTNRPWKTYASLIINHSQPVNKKWRSDGVFCKPGGKYNGTSYCSKNKLAWRDKMGSIINNERWDQIPEDIVTVATSFVRGKIPEPASDDGSPLVDFASTPGAKKHGTQYESGGNYFLSDEQVQNTNLTKGFIKDHVVVSGSVWTPGSEDDNHIGTKLAVAGWLIATGLAIWKLIFDKKK